MDVGIEFHATERADANATDRVLALFGAGLNAHNEILESEGVDIRSFRLLISGQDVRLLFACWSSTVLLAGNRLQATGNQRFEQALDTTLASNLIDGFGDHDGLLGCLDTSGNLYLLSESHELQCQSAFDDSSPRLGHIALARNGKVAVTFKQAPNGRLCHIVQFNSLEEFLIWYQDPSGVKIDAATQHFMMQGRPKQLVANTATFMVLMEGGEVCTWGDPRYQSLGRSISGEGEDVVLAERPGIVEALGGLKIEKIASGGWMCAALSADNALYIWGTGTPGTDQTIKFLRDAEAGEVVLVEIANESGEPLDITDVGIGDNHMAVIAEEKRLFVIGDNTNGQLGQDTDRKFLDTWTEVSVSSKAFQRIVCGPKATFVWTKDSAP